MNLTDEQQIESILGVLERAKDLVNNDPNISEPIARDTAEGQLVYGISIGISEGIVKDGEVIPRNTRAIMCGSIFLSLLAAARISNKLTEYATPKNLTIIELMHILTTAQEVKK